MGPFSGGIKLFFSFLKYHKFDMVNLRLKFLFGGNFCDFLMHPITYWEEKGFYIKNFFDYIFVGGFSSDCWTTSIHWRAETKQQHSISGSKYVFFLFQFYWISWNAIKFLTFEELVHRSIIRSSSTVNYIYNRTWGGLSVSLEGGLRIPYIYCRVHFPFWLVDYLNFKL